MSATSTVLKLAEAVTAELSSYGAVLTIVPELTLKETETLKILVVPRSATLEPGTRAKPQRSWGIDVGVMKRGKDDNIDEMLKLCETLQNLFLYQRPAGFPAAICNEIGINPLYLPEDLRAKNQFTSVLNLNYIEA